MAEHEEQYPEFCPAGHRLVPGRMLVGWQPCGCSAIGGHRDIECLELVGGRECGQRWERPECTTYIAPGR